ncbi:PH domain-containing protein [Streptomyces sp. NPDC002845]
MKSQQKFRNPTYPIAGILAIAICAFSAFIILGGATEYGFKGNDAFGLGLCALGTVAGFRAYFWSQIIVDSNGLIVRNPVRTHRVTWREVQEIRAADRVILVLSGGREIRCWAVQRANIARFTGSRSIVDKVAAQLEEMRLRAGSSRVLHACSSPPRCW